MRERGHTESHPMGNLELPIGWDARGIPERSEGTHTKTGRPHKLPDANLSNLEPRGTKPSKSPK